MAAVREHLAGCADAHAELARARARPRPRCSRPWSRPSRPRRSSRGCWPPPRRTSTRVATRRRPVPAPAAVAGAAAAAAPAATGGPERTTHRREPRRRASRRRARLGWLLAAAAVIVAVALGGWNLALRRSCRPPRRTAPASTRRWTSPRSPGARPRCSPAATGGVGLRRRRRRRHGGAGGPRASPATPARRSTPRGRSRATRRRCRWATSRSARTGVAVATGDVARTRTRRRHRADAGAERRRDRRRPGPVVAAGVTRTAPGGATGARRRAAQAAGLDRRLGDAARCRRSPRARPARPRAATPPSGPSCGNRATPALTLTVWPSTASSRAIPSSTRRATVTPAEPGATSTNSSPPVRRQGVDQPHASSARTARDLAQDLVAGPRAGLLVELAEPVDVEQGDRDLGCPGAARGRPRARGRGRACGRSRGP